MIAADMHTHTIASGHGTSAVISDMVRAARDKGIRILGITDHGPATSGAGTESYFRSIRLSPRIRSGIEVYYGVELNIVGYDGSVDLGEEILEGLDYAIASMHPQNLSPSSREDHTRACIQAMRHLGVKVIGHPDDVRYPLDYHALAEAASEHGVALEVNNSSLSPEGYRGSYREVREKYAVMLEACRAFGTRVILASDSHGPDHIGDFSQAVKVLAEEDFPGDLVLNLDLGRLRDFLLTPS